MSNTLKKWLRYSQIRNSIIKKNTLQERRKKSADEWINKAAKEADILISDDEDIEDKALRVIRIFHIYKFQNHLVMLRFSFYLNLNFTRNKDFAEILVILKYHQILVKERLIAPFNLMIKKYDVPFFLLEKTVMNTL